MIRPERMKNRISELNRIGYNPATGGVTRLGFTAEEQEAHRLICSWFADEKRVSIRQDACGNTILRMEGDGRRPAIAIGSHVDTVTNGGKYDGQAGVISGLEVLSCLLENNLTLPFPFEVIVFSSEESSRFGISTVGSKGMAGMLKEIEWDVYEDTDGIGLKQAMEAYGLDLSRLAEAERASDDVHLFLELHIEQGSVLEEAQLPVGLVTAISKPWRLRVTFEGKAAHSGSTPMNRRRNALVTAAEYMLFVDKKAHEWSRREPLVASVTMANIHPNNMNVIPGSTVLGVDIRSHKPGIVRAFVKELSTEWQAVWNEKWDRQGFRMHTEILIQDEPIQLDPQVVKQLEESCLEAGVTYTKLPSGAGHDVMNMASRFRAGLIFVPCPGGVSHHPEEGIDENGWIKGTEILLRTVLKENGYKLDARER
ncbi:Zn-dependent hydrolase [Brevibacillus sp. H7]|uniref:Zn-dependent hydrolase n=1 Tax=Brevibacillus sp. H7 TaxID=3349138 RepID=UPI003814FE08